EGARLLHPGGAPALPPPVPGVRAAPGGGGDPSPQVLVLRQRRGAGAPLRGARARPDAPLEALGDGPVLADEVGRLLPREGRDVRPHGYPGGALVHRRGRRQTGGSDQLHLPSPVEGAVRGEEAPEDHDPAAPVRRGLRPASPGPLHVRSGSRGEPDRLRMEPSARWAELLRSAPLVDGHNDLLWELRKQRVAGEPAADVASSCPQFQTDLPRLAKGGVGGQFWSVYVPSDLPADAAVTQTLEQVDAFRGLVAAHPDVLEVAGTADDVERIAASGRVASMIGVEGGHSIGC